ncbi:MAG: hypothetical protein HC822_04030 [Oscillochloris sp.]|nr:hypothetical protein [Oscillochloris sp.]
MSYRVRGGSAANSVDYQLTPGTLTFAAGSSRTSFTVDLVADTLDEAPETLELELYNASGGFILGPNPLVITIADTTEPPAVRFAQNALAAGEAAGTVSIPIDLSIVSGLDVSIAYTIGGSAALSDHSLRSGTLLIPAGSSGALLRVTITDDQIDEDDETLIVTLRDPSNATLGTPASHTLTIRDNDTAGVRRSRTALSLSEGLVAASYSLRLESQPVGNVLIRLDGSPQASVNPSTLTFTPSNWNITQSVVVSAVDDRIDEGNSYSAPLRHTVTSGDPRYNELTVSDTTLLIADNDTAGVIVGAVSPTLLREEFSDRATYTLRLNSQPTARVTINLSHGDFIGVSPASVSFNASNWNTPQTVTITALNDNIDHGDTNTGTVTHAVMSSDPFYSSIIPANANVTVRDGDTAQVNISAVTPAPIAEAGGSATYTISLNSQPTRPVTITLSTDGDSLRFGSTTYPTETITISFSASSDPTNPEYWAAPQTISVVADPDFIDRGGSYTSLVAHTATSGDGFYNGIAINPATVRIEDDDTAGIDFIPSNTFTTTEGLSITYSVRLTSEPTDAVTLNLAPSGLITLAPATLTFTATNWTTAQTVTVVATNDAVDRGDSYSAGVNHTAVSGDGFYNGLGATVPITIADNDTAGVTVDGPAVTPIAEDGGTITYTILLDSEPLQPVTIDLSTDGLSSVAPASVTFDATNWNATQTVTITALADFVDRGATYTSTVSHGATSDDGLYNGIAIAPASVNISDDDTAGVTVNKPAVTPIAEDGGTATYTVRLTSQPTAMVTIDATTDGLSSVTPTNLTFDATNWTTPQTITITALNDDIDRGATYTSTVSHGATSGDSLYNGIAIDPASVNISDDDTAGVIVGVVTPGTVPEEDGSATYTIVLDSEPTAAVTIDLTTDGLSTVSPTSLTFTAANWDTLQTVTITTISDSIDRGDTYTSTVSHSASSSDGFYNGIAVADATVTITDDDVAAVIVSGPSATAIAEDGGSATYTVRLNTEPTAAVTIALTTDGLSSVTPANLTFTTTNWTTAQTITITALNDDIDRGNTYVSVISHTASSGDGFYNGLAISDATVNISDDDTAGIVFTPNPLSIVEGATTGYAISLSSEPAAAVTVDLTPSGLIGITPASVTLDSGNWNSGVTVNVTATNDAVDRGNNYSAGVNHTTSSADSFYNSLGASLPVTIADNDTAGVTLNGPAVTPIAEDGGTATYTLVLDSEPTADVTIALTTDGLSTVAPTSLTFDATNWNAPQTVTITALNDDIDRGATYISTISQLASSGDGTYNGITIADANATINDDDTAGVTLNGPAATPIAEDGGTATYTLVLDSEPTADVTIALTTDGLSSVTPTNLTFDATNWTTPQTVTITALDDDIDRGAVYLSTISHLATSGDGIYNGIAIADANARISDDDTAGVTLSGPAATPIAENGGTATYTLVLDSEPTADVTIALTTDGLSTVAPTSLTFTASNWNTPQTVTITALNDDIDRGAVYLSTISQLATSGDGIYNGITIADASVTITDDDTADVIVTAPVGGLSVTEDGATDTYTVALASEPQGTVTISITSPDGQLSSTPTSLNFNPTNWNTPQTVTVSAVDDSIVESDPHNGTVAHTASSSDARYNGIVIAGLSAAIADNDVAGIVLNPTSLSVNEGGSGNYTVTLASQPGAAVIVTLTASGDPLTVSATTLNFNTTNWNIAQPLTLTSNSDNIAEGDLSATISHSATSGDPDYTLTGPDLTVTVVDDDSAGITINPTSLALNEGGSDTYTVVLTSEPLAPVSVSLSNSGDPLTVSATTLTFTSGNWNTPQTVTVGAADDDIAEGDQSATISHSASSGDPNYTIASGPNLAVTIADNDSAGLNITPLSLNVIEGGQTATYSVVLTSEPVAVVSVNSAAVNGQVTATPANLTFDASNWDMPQIVTVSAPNDGIVEANPHSDSLRHTATSSDPNYTIAAASAPVVTISILDPVAVRVNDLVRPEGNGGGFSNLFSFIVQLSRTSTRTITVNYEIVDGSTTQGDDYNTASGLYSGSLTFTPGQANNNFQIQINRDDEYEPDEIFLVRLTSVSASDSGEAPVISDGQGVGRINNDDVPTLSFSRGDYFINEDGGSIEIAVELSGPATSTVEVDYATIDSGALAGTALVNVDYTGVSSRLTFAPGETEQRFTINVLDDVSAENAFETVVLRLSNALGATINNDTTTLTIGDDDVVLPDARIDSLQTAGPNWNAFGWNYYAPGGGYTYLRIDVPCVAGSGTVRFDLLNPAIDSSAPRDFVLGGADPTTFELYRMPANWNYTNGLPDPGDPTSVAVQNFAPGNVASFSLYNTSLPGGCGVYLLRAETADNDTNGWGLQVGYEVGAILSGDLDGIAGSGDEITTGVQQATVRLAAASPMAATCETIYEYVRPGLSSVAFHNFDLETSRSRVRYYPPNSAYNPLALSGGIIGTVSGGSQWNNGDATTRGGDVIANPTPGWWRIVTCNTDTSEHNHLIQEGQTDVAAYFYQPPTPDLDLSLIPAASAVNAGATIDVSLDYANNAGPTAGAALNTILTVSLPPEFSLESCSITCSLSGSLVTIDLGRVATGTSGSISLTLRAEATAGGAIAALRVDSNHRDVLNNPFTTRTIELIDIN